MENKPFIHLYQSPNNFYFYDVNKDTIASINKSIYNYLAEKIGYDALAEDDKEYIESLKNEGFFSGNRVKNIRHSEMDSLKDSIENKCEQLILQVTQSCNLVCSYCPYANKSNNVLQRDHSNKMMSWETAKKAIDLFAENSSGNNMVAISFYGGEPLISFDLIKKCVEYAEELFLGKKITFNLTTNGTLMTEDMINYFFDHSFDLCFSLDGPASIHDINRRRADNTGSFEAMFRNLKKVAEIYGDKTNGKISTNTVLNPENDLDEAISIFDDEFFKNYHIHNSFSIAADDYLEKKFKVSEDFSSKYEYLYFKALLKEFSIVNGLNTPLINSSIMKFRLDMNSLKNGSMPLQETDAPGGPCIPGVKKIFVDVNENIFPCERTSEVSECMMIGNLEDGLDVDKAGRLLNVAEITADSCKNCYASRHCDQCAEKADDGHKLSAEKRLSHCKSTRSNFDFFIKCCIAIKEYRTYYRWRDNNEVLDLSVFK